MFGGLPHPMREWSDAYLPEESQQAAAMLGNHEMYCVRADYVANPLRTDSIYNTDPLRQTLNKLIEPSKLTRSETHLVVGTVDVANGEFKTFDNWQPGGLTIDQIVASGSLPPAFPSVTVMVDGKEHHYWDGGLFSNTPLSPAINCLEKCGADQADTRRELLVVELFPMNGEISRDLAAVQNRLAQLIFASKLNLDAELFVKLNSFIDLAALIDQAIPRDCAEIRNNTGYQELIGHKKIDAFNIIRAKMPAKRGNAGDFSKASIDWRIKAGYEDAIEQGIGKPKPVGEMVEKIKARARHQG